MMEKVYIDRDLEDLVLIFLEKRRQDIVLIKGKLEQADIDGVRLIAHGIKGSAGSYGFDEMSRIAAEIEMKAGSMVQQGLDELCSELEKHMNEIQVVYTDQ